jgi:hypothetical protein
MSVQYGFLYLILTGPELTLVLCSMFMKIPEIYIMWYYCFDLGSCEVNKTEKQDVIQ